MRLRVVQWATGNVGRAAIEGIVATAIHCVSAIPYICQADPGIKTYLDLPLVTGRAAPRLSSQ